MTQEEYKAMEMERMAKMNAAPLANQVFQPVQVTNVPPPPRAQEPQITPQQQQPGIGQQFGQALATRMITKGVDAVTGLPIMSSIGLSRGDKVPWWIENQPDPSEFIYDDPLKEEAETYKDEEMLTLDIGPLAQALPPGLTSTDMQILQFYGVDPFKASIEDAEHYGNLYEHQYGGMEFHPLADPDGYNKGGDVTQYEQPIDRALGTFDNLPERRIERGLIEKMGETRFFKLPLETQMSLLSSMGNSTRDIATFFRLKKMAPELSTMQLGYDEQKRLDDLTRSGDFREGPVKGMQMGGDVTYAETGRLVNARAPLAKPSAIDRGTPGPSMLQKYKSGAYPYTIPSMLRRRVDAHNQAAYKANLKDGDQGIIFRGGGGSTGNETNWEYAQRTGDIRTPFNNVVFTPEKQGATISYKREDVKPFTWMWNKGRNFLGFGAPLAGGSK